MFQHGQVFKLKTKGSDGQPLWAYRYRLEGRGSERPQVGGFATREEAEKALRKVLDRLGLRPDPASTQVVSRARHAELLTRRERARSELASVLQVEPLLVALTDSTTRGCQMVLAGLGLESEDEVVTTDQEHFGLLGPLYASGARARRVKRCR